MSDSKILKAIKTALGISVDLEKMKLADGQTVIEADTFENGSEVFVVTEEGNVPVPVGEYELEDGKILVVSEEGIIAEIKEKEEEKEEEEETTATTNEDEAMGDKTKIKKTIESMVKETVYSKMELLEKENANLKKQLEVSLSEINNIKLSMETASSEPISFNPSTTTSTAPIRMSQNRPKTTMDIILEKMNN